MSTKLFLSTRIKVISLFVVLVITVIGGIVFYYKFRTFLFIQPQQEKQSNRTVSADLNVEEIDLILSDIQENGISCELVGVDGVITKDKCAVDKVVGNYAKGSMPRAYWIALKSEDKWKVVITGNGIPACIEVDKFSIPTEIYGNCIESSGKLRFVSST